MNTLLRLGGLAVLLGCFVPALFAGKKQEKNPEPVEIAKYEFEGAVLPVFDGFKVRCDKSVPPVYPVSLKRAGKEGTATIVVVVNGSGKAIHIGATDFSEPEFAAASIAAAQRWKYFPIKGKDGTAFVHALKITLTFTLNGE